MHSGFEGNSPLTKTAGGKKKGGGGGGGGGEGGIVCVFVCEREGERERETDNWATEAE